MKIINWEGKPIEYEQPSTSICNCCGSSFYGDYHKLSNTNGGCGEGIGVYLTKDIPEKDTDKIKVDQITTRNGVITFALRKKK